MEKPRGFHHGFTLHRATFVRKALQNYNNICISQNKAVILQSQMCRAGLNQERKAACRTNYYF